MKEIKDKLSKMSDLLDELEISEMNKDKEYHLFIDEGIQTKELVYHLDDTREWRFFLYRLSDNSQICYGDKKRLKSFMRLRGIKPEKVIIEFDFGKW